MKKPMPNPDGKSKIVDAVPDRLPLDATIRAGIISSLGQPPGLFRVAVVRLWENHYRVNVLTGADAVTISIRHSYFVRTGTDGEIVSATPRITRLYS